MDKEALSLLYMDELITDKSLALLNCENNMRCNIPNILQLLPWGDKLTAESIQFFSPIVIWTKPGNREDIQGTVFSAFKEYLAVRYL